MTQLMQGLPVGTAFDEEAFNGLFEDFSANRAEIFEQVNGLTRIVASRHVNFRSPEDRKDACGAVTAFTMDLLDGRPKANGQARSGFDPTKGSPYDYLYQVILRQLRYEANRAAHNTLGDADAAVSFDDLQGIMPQDAANVARSYAPHQWKTFRVSDSNSRRRIERYFEATIQKAKTNLKTDCGVSEAAAIRVVIQTLLQTRRALVGY